MEETIKDGSALRSLPNFDLILPEAREVIDQRFAAEEAQTHFSSLQHRGFEDRWTVSPRTWHCMGDTLHIFLLNSGIAYTPKTCGSAYRIE